MTTINDFVALLIFSSVQDDHAPVWATRSAVSSPEVIYLPSQRNLFTENLSNISWLTLNLATTACAWAQTVDHIQGVFLAGPPLNLLSVGW